MTVHEFPETEPTSPLLKTLRMVERVIKKTEDEYRPLLAGMFIGVLEDGSIVVEYAVDSASDVIVMCEVIKARNVAVLEATDELIKD